MNEVVESKVASPERIAVFGRDDVTISRADRYKWNLLDQPGEFAMIAKTAIGIDHTYQRQVVSEIRVGHIRREFSWASFGALSVAKRPEGSYWVFDGQHRLLASRALDKIQLVPCIVFLSLDAKDEAVSFVRLNTARGNMSIYAKFRAQLVAGDALAAAVDRMVRSSGYHPSLSWNSQWGVKCIGNIMGQYATDPVIAERAWRLCARLFAGVSVKEQVFSGLCHLENFFARLGSAFSISDEDVYQRLAAAGVAAILGSIKTASISYGIGGHIAFSQGIIDILNRSRRKGNSKYIPSPIKESP